jgi:8-oxo-dGTP pyrophosphatase MutT (NUDIX family)
MKVFALNLCLIFEVKDPTRNYQFSLIEWDTFVQQIETKIPFQNQAFYIQGVDSGAFADVVFAFQADEKWRETEMCLNIQFDSEIGLDAFMYGFQAHFRKKFAAGGLVQNEEGEYLFIEHHGFWSLPKGHVERGEEIEETAVREVCEETGLTQVRVISKMQETHHTFCTKDKWKWKITCWYKMETDGKPDLEPQLEEDVTACEWISRDVWMSNPRKTYPMVRELLTRL